jgi:hypothetical protein
LTACPIGAQLPPDPFLVLEHWVELDPIVAVQERPVPRDVAVERLLDEAQITISGMVYGYSFRYSPGDPTRDVPEEFILQPRATIVRGDPRLDVMQTWVDDDLLYARISYTLDDSQVSWFNGWHSSLNSRSAGVGHAPVIRGPDVKSDALADGIRMAIRNHARQIEFNRPKLITGAVLLAEPPTWRIYEGQYETDVVAFIQIDSIERYSIY